MSCFSFIIILIDDFSFILFMSNVSHRFELEETGGSNDYFSISFDWQHSTTPAEHYPNRVGMRRWRVRLRIIFTFFF